MEEKATSLRLQKSKIRLGFKSKKGKFNGINETLFTKRLLYRNQITRSYNYLIEIIHKKRHV